MLASREWGYSCISSTWEAFRSRKPRDSQRSSPAPDHFNPMMTPCFNLSLQHSTASVKPTVWNKVDSSRADHLEFWSTLDPGSHRAGPPCRSGRALSSGNAHRNDPSSKQLRNRLGFATADEFQPVNYAGVRGLEKHIHLGPNSVNVPPRSLGPCRRPSRPQEFAVSVQHVITSGFESSETRSM